MSINNVLPKIIKLHKEDPRYDRKEQFIGKYVIKIEQCDVDKNGWCFLRAQIKGHSFCGKGFVYIFYKVKLSRIPKKFLKK